ncbi:MAG: hypothetical protein R3F39_16380 [Myxococcota bacterium]
MHGFVESLNVSVAFAIAVATLRQRLDALSPPAAGLEFGAAGSSTPG